MAKKAARSSSSSRRSEVQGPDINTSTDTAGADVRSPKQKAADRQEEADRQKDARTTRAPIVTPQNPPEQPKMIPAKQIEGQSGQALDPEDLPANRRNPDNAIRVQAKNIGYYDDVIRRVGDVFDIADEQAFSSKWMRRVPNSTPEQTTGSNAALEQAKKGGDPNRTVPEPQFAGGDVLGD